MVNALVTILRETIVVTGDMAPYLLFGFGIAGVLHVVISEKWLQENLGGPGLKPVFKAVLLGVPLPLCSCGVIGVSTALRRQGASRAAVTGFLISTPQTGVDSILATWGMLGPLLGIFRPLIAFITGLIGGAVVSLTEKKDGLHGLHLVAETEGECCVEPVSKRSISAALYYGFVTLPRDIAKPLVVGIVISGLIGALLPQGVLAPYIGGGWSAMIVMVALGLPMYVCATASIPLAVGFIHLGASPGAALAFLIAGPATNAATIATVWKTLGKAATIIYVGTVAVGGILSGLFFDMLSGRFAVDFHAHAMAHGHQNEVAGWSAITGTFVLAAVLLNSSYGVDIWRGLLRVSEKYLPADHGNNTIELTITGMHCENCARSLHRELEKLAGVKTVTVDFKSGKARVSGTIDDAEYLLRTVRKAGYRGTLSG